MPDLRPLPPDRLYTPCDPADFSFATTSELESMQTLIGQDRAMEAIRFGIRIDSQGYNIFVLGPSGIGKFEAVRDVLAAEARERDAPPDWCYVNNFQQPHKPRAISLPAGRGARLREDVNQLIDELTSAIPAAFESEQYRSQVEELEEELKERQAAALEELRAEARKQHIALIRTPSGFAFAPMDENEEVLRPDKFEQLSEGRRQQVQRDVEALQERLQKLLRQFPLWGKETREKLKDLNREIGRFAVSHLIDSVREQYSDQESVLSHLEAVKADIIDNVDVFRGRGEDGEGGPAAGAVQRYRVNVLVDNAGRENAPVVYEDHPTYANLVGRIEYLAQMGTLVTDFTLIKPGAMHLANGGYLLLDARQLLLQAFSWDGLKRALRAQELRIESLERSLGLISTVSLEPAPIPLDLKIIIVGDRLLYYLLYQLDPDFRDLFKVAADFEDDLQRSPESHGLYARLFATLCEQHRLRPMDGAAVGRLIEFGARRAGDAEKVSTHLRSLTDLLVEADFWAGQRHADGISSEDVQRALDAHTERHDRVRDRTLEAIRRGTVLIATDGAQVGQVNGLSVLQLGDFAFGQPSRITATVRLGEGRLIDIERETKLGGRLHSKGVLILSGFLAARYGSRQPLSMAASLVFEQSYGMVDGDSASMAELCALLSALARIPIRQSLAITGSINQLGQAQAIGGVNEKIEGFFDVCEQAGLNGSQGVLIPASNVKHLMLKRAVREAAAEEKFAVYPYANVDEAITLLTGCAAGEADEQGNYPADSVNGQVAARLGEMAEWRRSFAARPGETESPRD